MEISITPSDPRESVLRVLRIMQHKAEGKNLYLEFQDCELLPTVLELDSSRLSQIVLNLVSNAIKFTEKGKVSVSLDWEFDELPPNNSESEQRDIIPVEENNISERIINYTSISRQNKIQYLGKKRLFFEKKKKDTQCSKSGKFTICIKDTGIGIRTENLNKLFKLYSQAEASISSHYGGTGLGLWISQNLIHMMKGKIEVSSIFQQGTTFVISLPTKIGSEIPLTYSPNEKGEHFELLRNKRCLILDDIEDNTYILEQFIIAQEMCVASFTRGQAALEFLDRDSVDCIVTDLRMPEMSGQTFICKWREEEKRRGTRPIPIIVVSAESNPEDKLQCLSVYGANAFLVKPIKLSQLLVTIYNSLTGKEPRKKEILVVDDDRLSTVCMERIIRSQGHNILKAHTIKEAIEKIKEKYQSIDILFLDNELSDGTGKDLLKFISNNQKMKGLESRVISISGTSPDTMKKWYAGFQIQAFFQKPLSKSRILSLINMSS